MAVVSVSRFNSEASCGDVRYGNQSLASGPALHINDGMNSMLVPSVFFGSRAERLGRASLCAIALFAILTIDVLAGQLNDWNKFRGAFFEIGVPPGFKANAQQWGPNEQINAVSLWKESSRVEFYVFSPQWNGTAGALSLVPGEVLKSREIKREGKVQVVELEIAAHDGSYTRFVVSRTNEDLNTNVTWGIRVPNMKIYSEMRPIYLRWKQTLQQFADA